MADYTPDLHALAAAYALDALDADERRQFEAHYPTCPSCADELAGFRETAALLTVPSLVAPPADLKARVLADIARTPQLPPLVTSLEQRRRPPVVTTILAAAVALLLVGLAAVLLTGDGATDAQQQLASLLAAPDAVTVNLAGEGDGTLRVVYSADRDEAILVGSGLTAAGSDQTYQLWTIAGETPASAGVFDPDDDGALDHIVDAPGSSPDAWAVTMEPKGGSPAPTGDILFQGTA